MPKMEIRADDDGYVVCPRRGEISVEWCAGCPFRLHIDDGGDRVVVTCGAEPLAGVGSWPSVLRDVPDMWG